MDWKGLLKRAGRGMVVAAASVVAGVALGPVAATAVGGFLSKKMGELGVTVTTSAMEHRISETLMEAPGSLTRLYNSRRMRQISEEVAEETGVSSDEAYAAVQYSLREFQTTMSTIVDELRNDRNLLMMALQMAQQTDMKIDSMTELTKSTHEAIQEVRAMLRSMEQGLDSSYREAIGTFSERTTLNPERLMIASQLQRQNTALSSRFDVRYDSEFYVTRETDELQFSEFINNAGMSDRNCFLVLGDVGMGKTWFLARQSARTLEKDHPTFFVTLRHGIRSLTGLFHVQTLPELVTLFDSILLPARKHAFIFLDGLDEMPSREARGILSAISSARVGTVSFVLSCRCTDWMSDSAIVQAAHDMEFYIHECATATTEGKARGLSTPVSMMMTEFNENEMTTALERYGIPEEVPEGLGPLLRKPYFMRLASRKYSQLGELPSLASYEFLDLFAGEEEQTYTILGRLGIITERDALYQTVEQFINSRTDTLPISDLKAVSPESSTFRTLVSSGLLQLLVTKYGSAVSLSTDYMIPLLTITVMRNASKQKYQQELLDSLVEWMPHIAPQVMVIIDQAGMLQRPDTTEVAPEVIISSSLKPTILKETLKDLLDKGKDVSVTKIESIAEPPISEAAVSEGLSEDSSVEVLLEALGDTDLSVRLEATDLLGRIGDTRAVESLIGCLSDDDMTIRTMAIRSLGLLGDERAIEPLRTLASSAADKGLAIKARWAADRISDKKKSKVDTENLSL